MTDEELIALSWPPDDTELGDRWLELEEKRWRKHHDHAKPLVDALIAEALATTTWDAFAKVRDRYDAAVDAGEISRNHYTGNWTKAVAAHSQKLAEDRDKLRAFTLDEWLEREDIAAPDFLLGELLSTTSRAIIQGPTGLGKTMFGLAVLLAIAGNAGFLKWCAQRSGRVLYVDGEMPRRLMKQRLADAARRADAPRGLPIVALCREDCEDMPPLNTPEGQEKLDELIEQRGPFSFAIFDNIQALLIGIMKDEEQWAAILPYVKSLTKRRIGQLWFHHTGHDESHRYGSKAREWQVDLVGLMKRVDDPETDLAFTIEWTKARERTPDNRDQFEPVTLRLIDDVWVAGASGGVAATKLTGHQKTAYDALKRALADAGEIPPASNHIPPSVRTVSESLWRGYAIKLGIAGGDAEPKRQTETFKRAVVALRNRSIVGRWGEQCWLIK
jgi:hypothetical protein